MPLFACLFVCLAILKLLMSSRGVLSVAVFVTWLQLVSVPAVIFKSCLYPLSIGNYHTEQSDVESQNKVCATYVALKVTFLNKQFLSLVFLNSPRFHNKLQLLSTKKYWKFIFLISPYLLIYSGDGANTAISKFEVCSFTGLFCHRFVKFLS